MNKLKNLSVKLIAILFIMSSLQVSAKTPYEFSVYGGGGYSFFLFRPYSDKVPVPNTTTRPVSVNLQSAVSGTSSSGASGDLGVGFTGFVAPQFGLHVGLGLGFYNIGVKVETLNVFKEGLIDENGLYYDLHTTLSNYNEKHRTFVLSIPFMLHFQSAPNQTSWSRRSSNLAQGFYAKAGMKLNILLSNTYESSVAKGFNTAYYIEKENWAATQEFAGLGTFKGKSANGSFGYVQALFSFEAGMKWNIGDDRYVYTGAYLDYGLNDPSKDNRTSMNDHDYIDPKSLDLSLMGFAEKTHLMTIGIKLRMAFVQ
jgi:hypothetical protein